MIFCNTTKGSYWLSQTLTEAGMENILMNKDVDVKVSHYFHFPKAYHKLWGEILTNDGDTCTIRK